MVLAQTKNGMHLETTTPTSYRAPVVFTGAGPPLRDGVVSVCNGAIVSVAAHRRGVQAIDLHDCAIVPPLVNAHTHLEFSSLAEPFAADEGFPAWIKQVVNWRAGQAAREDYPQCRADAVTAGLRESAAAGVAAVGDIVTSPWFPQVYAQSPVRCMQFLELLGVSDERTAQLLHEARGHLSANEPIAPVIVAGLSPHSPYTTTPALVDHAARLSQQHRVPLAMHLAESREELAFLQDRSGPLASMLRSAGMWRSDAPPAGATPLDYLQALSKSHRALIVHGNYLTECEIAFIARHNHMAVAYCPRTHAHFGHDPYPLAALLNAGVRVALGTDSKASNPCLSVWEEARFVRRRHPSIPPEKVLEAVTANGAFALQCESQYGALAAGKSAAFSVIRLPAGAIARTHTTDDLWEVLFSAEAAATAPPAP